MPPTPPVQYEWVRPDARAVRFVGRVLVESERATYAWSGTGFEARFEGTAFAVQMEDAQNWHTLLLDGRECAPVRFGEGTSEHTVVSGLPRGEHTVTLLRRTEPLFGPTTLLGIAAPGGRLLAPPPPKPRRIEIVGDSISCGYGIEGTTPECPFSAETENHFATYGARLARALDAELSTIAWSGRGVVRNYAGEPGELMPELYVRTLPQKEGVFAADQSADWVIVHLGTNDYGTPPRPSPYEFAQGYGHLLARVRERNPTARIVCALGPLLEKEEREQAVRGIDLAVAARAALGDSHVTRYEFRTRNDQPGCDWHPGLATQKRMYEELRALLDPRALPVAGSAV